MEHRRSGDREALGWMRPEGDSFAVVDRLGRECSEPVDWFTAEQLPQEIRVKKDDWGDMTAPQIYCFVPFPMPATLRVRQQARQ